MRNPFIIFRSKIQIRNIRKQQRQFGQVIVPAEPAAQPIAYTVRLNFEFFRNLGKHFDPIVKLKQIQLVHMFIAEVPLHRVHVRNGVCDRGSCCKNSTPSVMRALYIAEFCHQIIALFRALRVQPRQTAVFGFNTDVFKIMRFVNKYRVDPEVIEKNSTLRKSLFLLPELLQPVFNARRKSVQHDICIAVHRTAHGLRNLRKVCVQFAFTLPARKRDKRKTAVTHDYRVTVAFNNLFQNAVPVCGSETFRFNYNDLRRRIKPGELIMPLFENIIRNNKQIAF